MKPVVISSPNGHYYRNGGAETSVETAFSLMTSGTDPLDALVAGVNLFVQGRSPLGEPARRFTIVW